MTTSACLDAFRDAIWGGSHAIRWARTLSCGDPADAPPAWRSLRPHQRYTACWLALRLTGPQDAVLLADEPGLGKTRTALTVGALLGRPLHVFTPASVVSHWRREAARLGFDPPIIESHARLSIGPSPRPTHALIVVDEAHHLTRSAVCRTRHLAQLRAAHPLLFLTATPAPLGPAQLDELLAHDRSQSARRGNPSEARFDHALDAIAPRIARWTRETAHVLDPLLNEAIGREPRPDDPTGLGGPNDDPACARARIATGVGLHTVHWTDETVVSESPNEPLRDALHAVIEAVASAGIPGPLIERLLWLRWQSSSEALRTTLGRFGRAARRVVEARGNTAGRRRRSLLATMRAEVLRDDDGALIDQLVLPFDDPCDPNAEDPASREEPFDPTRWGELIARVDDALQLVGQETDDARCCVRRIADRVSLRPTAVVLWYCRDVDTVRRLASVLEGDGEVWCLTGGGCGRGRIGRWPVDRAIDGIRARAVDPRRQRPILVLATDVASEGLDLPEADGVVHHDLPWNPVRLRQREGRIERPGGPLHAVRVTRLPPPDVAPLVTLHRRLSHRTARLRSLLGSGTEPDAGDVSRETSGTPLGPPTLGLDWLTARAALAGIRTVDRDSPAGGWTFAPYPRTCESPTHSLRIAMHRGSIVWTPPPDHPSGASLLDTLGRAERHLSAGGETTTRADAAEARRFFARLRLEPGARARSATRGQTSVEADRNRATHAAPDDATICLAIELRADNLPNTVDPTPDTPALRPARLAPPAVRAPPDQRPEPDPPEPSPA